MDTTRDITHETFTVSGADGVPLAATWHRANANAPAAKPDGPEATRPPTAARKPVLVAVHGYPDHQGVWNALLPHVADAFDVVTYDIRGAGRSGDAPHPRAYDLDRLVADMDAVVEATRAGGRQVHLLGHDWGSIQAWQAVTASGATSTCTSFTSVSGPCLDHVARWWHRGLRPGSGYSTAVLRQARASAYIPFLCVPPLAEVAGRTGLLARVMNNATEETSGIPGYRRHARDIRNGLALYRVNMLNKPARLARALRSRPPRTTSVPVQILTPTHDPYVTPALAACATPYLEKVTLTPIHAGHWAIATHPALLASAVTGHAAAHPATVTSRR